MKNFGPLICFGLLLFSVSVFAQDVRSVRPKYQMEQVIIKAKKLALEKGVSPEKYFLRRVDYNWSEKVWSISFQGDVPAIGNDAFITYDEKTDKLDFMWGR